MNVARTTRGILPGLWLAIGGWGCSEGRPHVESPTEEATVSGTVSIKGQPVADGTIVFDPTNVERKMEKPRTAPIKDGAYTITTLIGDNIVRIEGKVAQKTGVDAGTHPFKVARGENRFNLEL